MLLLCVSSNTEVSYISEEVRLSEWSDTSRQHHVCCLCLLLSCTWSGSRWVVQHTTLLLMSHHLLIYWWCQCSLLIYVESPEASYRCSSAAWWADGFRGGGAEHDWTVPWRWDNTWHICHQSQTHIRRQVADILRSEKEEKLFDFKPHQAIPPKLRCQTWQMVCHHFYLPDKTTDVSKEEEGSSHLLSCARYHLTGVKHWLVSLSLILNLVLDAGCVIKYRECCVMYWV